MRVTRRWPRSPWYQARHEHDGQTDQQRETRELLQLSGPLQQRADVGQTLQQSPGTRGVGNAPLHHLAAAQSVPDGSPLPFRRLGHLKDSRMFKFGIGSDTWSLRQLHVELDRRELLGRQAVGAEKRNPAGVRVDIGEQRIDGDGKEN